MLANADPRARVISLGHTRYAHEVVSETKEFTLCFPSANQIEDVLYCGTHSGREVDKMKETKLKTLPASKIKAPIITDSIACFECQVTKTLNLADHTLFVGEILVAWISGRKDKVYSRGGTDLYKLEI